MPSRKLSRKRKPRSRGLASRRTAGKFRLTPGTKIDYKEFNLLKKFITERGKILSRRIIGTSPKEQRLIAREVKRARYLGLLPTGAR